MTTSYCTTLGHHNELRNTDALLLSGRILNFSFGLGTGKMATGDDWLRFAIYNTWRVGHRGGGRSHFTSNSILILGRINEISKLGLVN